MNIHTQEIKKYILKLFIAPLVYILLFTMTLPLPALDSLCPDGTAWPAADDAEKHCPGQRRMGMLMYECRTNGQGYWKRSVAERECPMPPLHRAGRTMIPQRDIEFMGSETPPVQERSLYYMQSPDEGGPVRAIKPFDYDHENYIPTEYDDLSLLKTPSGIDN